MACRSGSHLRFAPVYRFPSAIDGEEDDALASYNTRDDDDIFHDAGLVDGSDSDDEFLEGHVQATHHGDLEGDDDESSEVLCNYCSLHTSNKVCIK